MKNPFKHIRNWIKGELRRIAALLEAINKLNSIDVMKATAIKKAKDDKVKSDKLSTNKFTITAIFKNESEKASEVQKI